MSKYPSGSTSGAELRGLKSFMFEENVCVEDSVPTAERVQGSDDTQVSKGSTSTSLGTMLACLFEVSQNTLPRQWSPEPKMNSSHVPSCFNSRITR